MTTTDPPPSTDQFLPEIRRARYDRLTIYEVEESELTILEKGSADSTYLNFAIAFLSIAVSLTVTLATAAVPSHKAFTVFVVIAVIGYAAGLVLGSLWWRGRTSVGVCVKTIRSRLSRSDPWAGEIDPNPVEPEGSQIER
jgi:hypothetical protein